MSNTNKRMVSQDIAKGCAILMVCLLHIVEVPQIIRIVVGLTFGYAMPFFLLMTGYNYRNKGLTPWQNIKKRLVQILRPYLLYTFIIAVFMSIHFVLNGEATVMQCVQSYAGFLISKWGTPYLGWDLPKILFQRVFGPLWFIQFLIPASVIFYLFVDKALEDKKHFWIITLALATVSVIMIELGLVLPWGLQDSCAIAAIMIMGAYIRKDGRLFTDKPQNKYTLFNCLICLVVIAVIELSGNTAGYFPSGEMSAVWGGPEVYVTMLISFVGSYLLINISRLIERVKPLANMYIWLGRHSLLILFLHLSIAHLVIDFFGYQQMITDFPVAVEHISIDQIITFVVTMAIMIPIILGIEKLQKRKEKKA